MKCVQFDQRGDFLVFKVTSEYQRIHQIPASCCCCCAASMDSWKEPNKSKKKPGLRTGQHSEIRKALHWGLKNISQKQSICLWMGSSFSKSLGGHWKAPVPSWHPPLISVLAVMVLHTWTQLRIFLGISMNNSPYICGSDGLCVHSVHSSITSQAWVNHLCSYKTGRQVLLHFADGDHKARDKMSQLCLQRNFVLEPVFRCSLLTCCLQGLIAFEAVQLQALWPQAISAASSKTNSIRNKHGMRGDSAVVLVWATPTKWTWEMTEWVSLWATAIKLHYLSQYIIYIRVTSPFETHDLVLNRVELIWKTSLYFEHLFLKMDPCTSCVQLPDCVLTCLCISGQDSENRIVPTQTLESVYELWIPIWN